MSTRAALVGTLAVLAMPPILAPSPSIAQARQVEPGAGTPDPPRATLSNDDDATLPIPPVPPRIAQGPEYEACLDRLASDPSGAEAAAASLAAAGAKEASQHCLALAQVELGNSEDGAAMLDKLAATSTAQAASRAQVFGQASQAWTMAGNVSGAYASASQAVSLSPDDADLRIGRAIAGLALHRYAEAEDDLDHALDLDPKRGDALTLRATARRAQGKIGQAQDDIDRATALDPENPDTLLERGIIEQRRGKLDAARQDWQRAASLAPDTPTADLAEQNLALLEAGPRQ